MTAWSAIAWMWAIWPARTSPPPKRWLNDVAAKLAFAYLDDLFTALADCTPQIALDLDKDPYLDITLEDITPREGSSLNEPTPHIF